MAMDKKDIMEKARQAFPDNEDASGLIAVKRIGFVEGYEQAISDIAWIVLGEKMRQNDVSIERVSDAIKNSNVNGIVNAINANCKELSKE